MEGESGEVEARVTAQSGGFVTCQASHSLFTPPIGDYVVSQTICVGAVGEKI